MYIKPKILKWKSLQNYCTCIHYFSNSAYPSTERVYLKLTFLHSSLKFNTVCQQTWSCRYLHKCCTQKFFLRLFSSMTVQELWRISPKFKSFVQKVQQQLGAQFQQKYFCVHLHFLCTRLHNQKFYVDFFSQCICSLIHRLLKNWFDVISAHIF